MTMPTAEEILSLYLYGQRTPPTPAQLANEQWIRPSGVTESMNAVDYMSNGGGRFVGLYTFKMVREFLAAEGNYTDLAAGTYTPSSLYSTITGVTNEDEIKAALNLGVSQYFLGQTDIDFADRAYVFGSTAFRLNDDARFIVQ